MGEQIVLKLAGDESDPFRIDVDVIARKRLIRIALVDLGAKSIFALLTKIGELVGEILPTVDGNGAPGCPAVANLVKKIDLIGRVRSLGGLENNSDKTEIGFAQMEIAAFQGELVARWVPFVADSGRIRKVVRLSQTVMRIESSL